MKISLVTIAFILWFQTSFSQKFDANNPAMVKLQNKYNEAIKIAMTKEKLPWSSAIVIADATVNHILDADFHAAELYLRKLNEKESMSTIDSTIQFNIIFNAFLNSPELAEVVI